MEDCFIIARGSLKSYSRYNTYPNNTDVFLRFNSTYGKGYAKFYHKDCFLRIAGNEYAE